MTGSVGDGRVATAGRVVAGVGALAAVGAAAYFASGQHRRIGARPEEVSGVLPGDDLFPQASVVSTRAISIDAPPDYVWPWVAQMGQDKGGFYSYTWAENLVGCNITNADRIVEEWQSPQVGDTFRLHPDVCLEVAIVDPPHALVVCNPEPAGDPSMGFDASWAFVIDPEPTGRGVRLIVRERYLPYGRAAEASIASVGVVSAAMSVGMLRGIRGRAERLFHSGI